jgi:hypothetical protein
MKMNESNIVKDSNYILEDENDPKLDWYVPEYGRIDKILERIQNEVSSC